MTWAYRMAVDLDTANLHLAAFEAAGVQGFSEEHGRTTAWFDAPVDALPVPGRWEDLGDPDWHAEYRRFLTPVTVGGLTVAPPWTKPMPRDAIVVLPGQAFGTGHHETTTGCLRALQELPLAGRRVLDVGTGSGILAIAAARLGAGAVVAVDTDPLACEAAAANAAVNGVAVDVRQGSVDAVTETFDVVVANIDTATLGRLAPALLDRLRPDGAFIGSGVSLERVDEVLVAFARAGTPVQVRDGREWAVLIGRRSAGRPGVPGSTGTASAAAVEMVLHGMAHGGDAVGRLPDGRACFVPFALPGERVLVRVVEQRKRHARAELLEVLEPSPDRAAPPCVHFGPGRCGGCQLQHIAPAAQAPLKERVVREQLQHIGKLADPPVEPIVAVTPTGYRSTARFAVDAEGRLGFRRAHSHDVHPVDRCLLLDEATQALRQRVGDRWHPAGEVVVRTGTRPPDDAVVTIVPARGGRQPHRTDLDASVVLDAPGAAPLALRGDGAVTITVGGFDYRVSATSFFQTGPQGAEVLLRLVRDAAAVQSGDTVLELFAGVGLFSRGLAADGAAVTAVEADATAAGDLAHNLSGTGSVAVHGDSAEAVASAASGGDPVDVVVLDPPRRGAGADLSAAVTRLGARTVVYVACDPAALARDSRTFVDGGYDLVGVVPVDQFPQTAAIEAVARFRHRADR